MSRSLHTLLLQTTSWLGHGFLDLILPPSCFLCSEQITDRAVAFCTTCRTALASDAKPSCPRCATSIGPFSLTKNGCPFCRRQGYAFKSALRLGLYENQLKKAVLLLKSPRYAFLGPLMAQLWIARDRSRFEDYRLDAIIPIPSHWQRWLWRGINPMDSVGKEMGRLLGIPCHLRGLRRIRFTPMQPSQQYPDRIKNLANAFAVPPKTRYDGQNLLLLDDVLTSGATANEAARPLFKAGAANVVVAMLARAPLAL